MSSRLLRIGTRDSQLAVWQATLVQDLLLENGVLSELVYIKSEGDIDTVTPLYELGVQGIFTKTLDAALLNNRIDIAVHSMKDVPTRLAKGIQQAAVLKRASYKDIFVPHPEAHPGLPGGKATNTQPSAPFRLPPVGEATTTQPSLFGKTAINNESPTGWPLQRGEALPPGGFGWAIATSSIRRRAQWLHRYPRHTIENLRGNVNTRLRKLKESSWAGAIFAAAGLERIHLRPDNAIDLDWMLPAPAQGAIMIVCREEDSRSYKLCQQLNDDATALCTGIEKDFLRVLMGGCSTPISALAEIKEDTIFFRGNICSPDGVKKIEVSKEVRLGETEDLGSAMAQKLLQNSEALQIIETVRHAKF